MIHKNRNKIQQAADTLKANKDRLVGAATVTAALFAAGVSPASASTAPKTRTAAEKAAGHRSLRAVQREVEADLTNQASFEFWRGTVQIIKEQPRVTGGSKYREPDTGGREYGGSHGGPKSSTYLTNPAVVKLRDPRSTKSYNEIMDYAFVTWKTDSTGQPKATLHELSASMRFIPDESGAPVTFDPNQFEKGVFEAGPTGLQHTMAGMTGSDGTPLQIGLESKIHLAQ